MHNDIALLAPLAERLRSRYAIDDGDVAAIHTLACVPRDYDANQYLLREGDRPKFCSLLASGFVFRHKIVADGGRQIVSIHMRGDIFDAQDMLLREADHNIQALTAARIVSVAYEDMLAMCFARPNVGKALWRETLIEAAILREWVANIGRRDARTRTAHMICELAVRREAAGLGPRETYELPMTQEQMGDALGLTAVHINRTLKSLQDDALISRSKRSVTVVDWNRLSRAADFSSTYLHMDAPPR